MIRRPPRSTLFPYRRSSDLASQHQALLISKDKAVLKLRKRVAGLGATVGNILLAEQEERSEEHTSELQSPCNLVCRLLLEKKKNTYNVQLSTLLVACVLSEL